MPAQERIGGDDRGDLAQPPTAQAVRPSRKPAPVVIGQLQASLRQAVKILHGSSVECRYGLVDVLVFSTTRSFTTPKAPGIPCALMPAMFLSPSLSTTPSSVICPFFTMMWIG